MKHPLSNTIDNLKWLQEKDIPQEIWEKHFVPRLDELNIIIDKFKFMIMECDE